MTHAGLNNKYIYPVSLHSKNIFENIQTGNFDLDTEKKCKNPGQYIGANEAR